MEDSEITRILLDISSKVSAIDSRLTPMSERYNKLEERVFRIEDEIKSKADSGLKDQLIQFGLKALISLIAIIASLTGAGAILKDVIK